MNSSEFNARPSAPQVCTGCEGPISPTLAAALLMPSGRVVPVCSACRIACHVTPDLTERIGHAGMAGTTLPHVRRIFARFGLADVPLRPSEVDSAMRKIMAAGGGPA